MTPDDPRAVMVAIGFGVLLGWGLGRRAENRRASLVALAVAIAVGVGMWASTRGAPALALVVGGAVGLGVVAACGRR